ncbi:DUF4362 domain-containing protein [Paenibacillus mendelii]|uniref:DUF4362 domain-containing protein n=1 Tax=Paenibacillus mendelii TaxID=206163 RepID=A0ABV6JLW8_9BACL|nr:DUF4362 domain-containing protein [Paenibacillus mendelii]MCQ6558716.1 DUF4362 domain-containing protein [Paenibacillus mendelii]
MRLKTFILCLAVLLLTSCNSYSVNEAKKNGDIITGSAGEINLGKIDTFMNDVENNKESKVRITGFGIDGEPVVQDLGYDGNQIKYVFDPLGDKLIEKTVCDKIEKTHITREDQVAGFEYALSSCEQIVGVHREDGNEILILFVADKK